MQQNGHTIILMQINADSRSRRYLHYENMYQAMEAICSIFEEHLKRENPDIKQVQYGTSDIYGYLDGLNDIIVMEYNNEKNAYEPHKIEWIKLKLFEFFKQLGQKQNH